MKSKSNALILSMDDQTTDPRVEAIVAKAQAISELPTANHHELYAELLDELTQELDTEPQEADFSQ